jgi:hypothetical protein
MLQEHPSSAGSALEKLTTDYAGAGIKGRNGIAQALRALAPLLGEPQVCGVSVAKLIVQSSTEDPQTAFLAIKWNFSMWLNALRSVMVLQVQPALDFLLASGLGDPDADVRELMVTAGVRATIVQLCDVAGPSRLVDTLWSVTGASQLVGFQQNSNQCVPTYHTVSNMVMTFAYRCGTRGRAWRPALGAHAGVV